MAEKTHSPLGASSSERWLACPKSYDLIKRTGAQGTSSPEAALGTAAHALAEACLESNKEAWEFTGQTVDGHIVGTEQGQIDPDAVQAYLNYVRALEGEAYVEQRIGGTWKPHPLYGGTADFVAVGDDWIEVVDYKHGAGIVVTPEANPQLMYYAIGALKEVASHLPDTALVHMTIVQPRAPGETVRSCSMPVGELRHWSRSVLVPGMLKAEAGEGDFATGEHCRFCPAILDCPKQHEALKTLNQADVDSISDEQLDLLYPTFATVKMFIRAAEGRLQARLMEGASLNNVKLANKRSAGRIWKDGATDLLVQKLGEDAYEKSILSPAKAEKLSAKWKDFVAEYAFLPPSTGYNLVPATDSAPAANLAADIQTQYQHYTGETK